MRFSQGTYFGASCFMVEQNNDGTVSPVYGSEGIAMFGQIHKDQPARFESSFFG